MSSIIVSGARGTGKSTVCEKTADLARSRGYAVGGVITRKAHDGGLMVLDLSNGENHRLATARPDLGIPYAGDYLFDSEGIDFGVRAIERGAACDLLVIDEISYLELDGNGFACGLDYCVPSRNTLIVIRTNLLAAFTPYLGGNLTILETTVQNRDELPHRICSLLPGKEIHATAGTF